MEESQAVFQTLCRLRLGTHPLLPGKGLVLTVRPSRDSFIAVYLTRCEQGKGYPDVATRQLLNALSENLPP